MISCKLCLIILAIANFFGNIVGEYTSARSPQDFCNGIESPPEKIIFINEHGQLEEIKNPKDNQSSDIIHQVIKFQADPKYQIVSSSGGGKSIRNFDLNEMENPMYKQSSHNVYRVIQFLVDPNDKLTSTSGGGKSIGDIDLNEMENPKYNQSSQSVHQVIQFLANPNDKLTSLSGCGKSIRNFDLNEIPSNEDE